MVGVSVIIAADSSPVVYHSVAYLCLDYYYFIITITF